MASRKPKSHGASVSASAASITPSPERHQHDLIERLDEPIKDAAGIISRPFLVIGLLLRLEELGEIPLRDRRAGEAFHAAFQLAGLDGLKAAALDRVMGQGETLPLGNERGRRHVAQAIRALGGHGTRGAECVWHVLGLEWSLRRWAAKALRGNAHVAKGVLIAALPLLPREFRA